MVNNREYDKISKIIDNKILLKKYLDEIYSQEDSSVLREVGQAFVDSIVVMLAGENAGYYEELLLQVQHKYGSEMGGTILYDYVPQNVNDLKLLLSFKKIRQEFKENQKFVLNLGQDFLPSFIYKANLQDPKFVKELFNRYPYLTRSANIERLDR